MKSRLLFVFFFVTTIIANAQTKPEAKTQPVQNSDTTAAPGLPVLRSYVAPQVIAIAIKRYGHELYSIEEGKPHEDGRRRYLVGIIRRGHLSMEWMDELKIAAIQRKSPVNSQAAS